MLTDLAKIRAAVGRLFPAEITARLGGSAFRSLVLKISHAALGFCGTVLLARTLGPKDYGIYAFALALVMLLAIPAQAGLPTLIVREVSKYDAQEEWGLLRGLLRRANQGVTLVAVAIVVAAVSASFVLGARLTPVQRSTFMWALALLPLVALGNIRGAALRGLRYVVLGQLPEQFVRPALFVVSLAIIVVLGTGHVSPPLAMAIKSASAFVAFAFGAWLLSRKLPENAKSTVAAYNDRAWLRSVLPLTFLSGIELINNQTDMILLGVLTTAQEVGIYRVVSSGAAIIIFTLGAANFVVGPHIARAYASGNRATLQRLVSWAARIVLFTALPPAVVLIFWGRPILTVVFGESYAVGAGALAILCWGQLTNAVAGSVALILNMTGHERDTVIGAGVAAILNLVLNLILIPPFGIEGAAVATAASLATWNALLFLRVRRRLNIVSAAWGSAGDEAPR